METVRAPSVFKPILKILVTPACLLGFYLYAPSLAENKIHEWIEKAIRNSPKIAEAHKTQELAFISGSNMESVCNGTQTNSTGEYAKLRAVLEREGECGRFDRFAWGWLLSAGLLVGLTFLLGFVSLLARNARSSRKSLIRNYKIGWRLSMTAALSKLLIQTPLLAYACFEFTVLINGHYYPKLLLIIVVGAGAALATSVKMLLQRVPMVFGEVNACEIERHENPTLWRVIDETSKKLGVEPPNHVIAGFTTDFYVTELFVKHSEGQTTGKTLYLSIPLMRLLSPSDIVSIVGHELGHFQGEDTALSREFYPLHFKSNSVLAALAGASWVGATAFHLVDYFSLRFATVEKEESRKRELAADRFGAQATSPRQMAEALVRVIVYGDAHDKALYSGRAHLASAEESIKERDALLAKPDFFDKLLEEKLSHPLDSHPKLSIRLASLETELSREDAVRTLKQEARPCAYDSWFSGKEKDIEAIEKAHLARVEDLGSRGQVKDADYETSAGQALLDRHFPPVEWNVSTRRLSGIYGLLGLCLAICVPLMIFVPDPIVKLVCAICAVPFVSGIYCVRGNHQGGKLSMNAAGMTYTGWSRPVDFKDIADVQLQNVNGQNVLSFVFSKKGPPLNRHNVLPFIKRKTYRVPAGHFDVSEVHVIKTILTYYHRALPETPASSESEAA